MNNDGIKDAYELFFEHFNISKEKFYEFGLMETIYPPIELVDSYWEDLKFRLFNNQPVTIRGYGRDAHGTELYIQLHKELFGNENIIKDPTNNAKPQKIMESLTGFKRRKNLLNYQVSHVFGKTRNALLFEAPWNIVLIPKIIDPLTGHESKGDWGREYQELFLETVSQRYSYFIEDYNKICEEYISQEKIDRFIEEKAPMIIDTYSSPKKKLQLLKDFRNDFSKIEIKKIEVIK